jgi:hypothetical protein
LSRLALAAALIVLVVLAALSSTAVARRALPGRPPPLVVKRHPTLWARAAGPPTDGAGRLMTTGKHQFLRHAYVEAAATFTRAAGKLPRDPEPYIWLARSREKLDDQAGCYAAATEARKRMPSVRPAGDPGSPLEPERSLLVCAFATGHYAEAVTAGEAVLGGSGMAPEVRSDLLLRLALAEAAIGRLGDAASHAEQAHRDGRQFDMWRIALVLAMIYDRAGRDAEAHDAAVSALIMAAPSSYDRVFAVPSLWAPGDADYAAGLMVMAAIGSSRGRLAPLRNDRLLARAFFQRYVDRAAAGPWTARARAHLYDLGGPELASGELWVGGELGRARYERIVHGLLPALRKCLGTQAGGIAALSILLPPGADGRSAPGRPPVGLTPRIKASAVRALPVPQSALDCLQTTAASVSWPVPPTLVEIDLAVAH